MEITVEELLNLVKESSSAPEFKLKCGVCGVDPDAVFNAALAYTKNFWAGQWSEEAMQETFTLEEFFKAKSNGTLAYGDMTSVFHSMLYLLRQGL